MLDDCDTNPENFKLFIESFRQWNITKKLDSESATQHTQSNSEKKMQQNQLDSNMSPVIISNSTFSDE
jgi:hypothetical protein